MSGPVYVDDLFNAESANAQAFRCGSRHGHQWCHLWSNDLDALHAIARKIGLKREWFQDRPGFPHYDLVPTKRDKAIAAGAIIKPLREWIMEKRQGLHQTSPAPPQQTTLNLFNTEPTPP